MAELSEIRKRIDEVDCSIVEDYRKRMDLCKEVAEYKKNSTKAKQKQRNKTK